MTIKSINGESIDPVFRIQIDNGFFIRNQKKI
jgi:hypothetical protein